MLASIEVQWQTNHEQRRSPFSDEGGDCGIASLLVGRVQGRQRMSNAHSRMADGDAYALFAEVEREYGAAGTVRNGWGMGNAVSSHAMSGGRVQDAGLIPLRMPGIF